MFLASISRRLLPTRGRRFASPFTFVVLCLLQLSALFAPQANAQVPPDGFQEVIVQVGLSIPVAIEFASDGRIFIAEKGGVIKVLSDWNDETPTVFADLSTNVYDFWDRGLLGFALHPDFPAEPYVYVLYTYDSALGGVAPEWSDDCPFPPGATASGCAASGRLSRLEADGDVMIGSEEIFIEDWCQQYPSHSQGSLVFGADGMLYVSSGDGASFTFVDAGQVDNPCGDPADEGGALRSQDLATSGDTLGYDGAVLRLDPLTGEAPADNPLYGGATSEDDRIIAYGLRNPFRTTVHPTTGEIWIADVGWSDYEEINRIADPTDAVVENFGWPCYEGVDPQPGYDGNGYDICEDLYADPGSVTAPFFDYSHSEEVAPNMPCGTGSSAITGIVFYPGGPYPDEYDGALFFCDYSRGCIWVMFPDAAGDPDPTNIITFNEFSAGPVELAVGPDGYLYYVAVSDSIRRFDFFPANEPPIAVISADAVAGTAPLTVNYDGSGSSDPDTPDPVTFEWDLDGDGAFDDAFIASPSFLYTDSGSYQVSLRVTDGEGATGTTSVAIAVNNTPPVPVIESPAADTAWAAGDAISFLGSATDAETGVIPESSLSWEVILHHCHHDDPLDCHEHPLQTFSGTGSGIFAAPDHDYPADLEIRLTATDGGVDDWWDLAWLRRRRLPIDNSAQSETLVDFPLLVRLDSERIDYTLCAAGGADLRFLDPDGTLLAHEVEVWNPAGTSAVWVRVPAIDGASAADYITMYYGNGGAPEVADPAGVWGEFGGVWHLAAALADSTSNGGDGTNIGTVATAGYIGDARSFDGVDDYVDCGTNAALEITGAMTLEAWIKIDDPDQSAYMRVLSKKEEPFSLSGYNLEYNPLLNLLTSLSSGADYLRAEFDLDAGWHYVAATLEGTTGAVYVDGVEETFDNTADALVASTQALHIGRRSGGGDYFDGAIDEVRISATFHSDDWFAAQYLSMTDAMVTFGPEQDPGILTATVVRIIDPLTSILTLESVPPGLELIAGAEVEAAPFSHTLILNSLTTVTAPAAQDLDGVTYLFESWSDGGAASHAFNASALDETLVATYVIDDTVKLLRGDANGDAVLDIADVIASLGYLFTQAPANCLDAHDANDDGAVDISDPIYTLSYLYLSGAAPPPPFGGDESACGVDPTADAGGGDLGCTGPVVGCP